MVVGFSLITLCLIVAVTLVRSIRRIKKTEFPIGKDPNSILIFLNRHAKLKAFLKRHLVGDNAEPERKNDGEIDRLRAEIARLFRENSNLRELHGTAVGHLELTRAEIKILQRQREADDKAIDLANQRRIKAQDRADLIERQLHDLIEDVEQLYRENSRAGEFGKIKERLGYISDPVLNATVVPPFLGQNPVPQIPQNSAHPDFANEMLQSQSAEIERLKSLLVICREQITTFIAAKK